MRRHVLPASWAHRSVLVLSALSLSVTSGRAADVTSTLIGSGLWTNNGVWTSPLFPNNGNGGFTYDAVVNSGSVDIPALTQIIIQALAFTGGQISGDGRLQLNAASTWTGGTLAGGATGLTLQGAGSLTATGVSEKLFANAVTNAGTLLWQEGLIRSITPGATFTNSGLVDLQGDGTSFAAFNPGTVVNAVGGTLRRSVGTGTATVALPVANQGTIDVDTGVLALEAGGNWSGAVDVAAGTQLDLSGSFAYQNGASSTGAGLVRITGGTIGVSGAASFTNLEIAGGTLTADGAGALAFNGASTWTGGTLAGGATGLTLQGAGSLTATGVSEKLFANAVTNAGTLLWQEGLIRSITPGATFTNSGLVDLQGDGTSFAAFNPGTVVNAVGGTLRRSVGTGTATVALPVANQGTIDVDTGVLALEAGGNWSGAVDVAAGTQLDLSGSFAYQNGASSTGAGLVRITGGTIGVSGAASFTNLEIAGGTLTADGAGALAFNGASTWTGGTLAGGATGLTLQGAGSLTATGVSEKLFANAVTNAGTLLWQEGLIRSITPGATFTNSGLVDLQGDGTSFAAFNPGTVVNAVGGTLRRSVGTGTATVALPVANQGTIDVDTGVLALEAGGNWSGAVDVAAGTQLDLSGSFAYQNGASSTGAGLVRITGGTIGVSGAASFTNLEIAGGTLTADGAGALAFNGASTWTGGTLAGGATGLTLQGAGSLTATGVSEKLFANAVTNAGTLLWQEGLIRSITPGATFTNSGLVDLQGDGTSFAAFNPGTVVNAVGGTLRRSVGTGTATVALPVANQGTIDVDTGVLALEAGGNWSGAVDVAAGTQLDLSGSFAYQNGASSTGAGLVRITGGTIGVSGAASFTNLEVAGGTFNANGDVTVSSSLSISGGAFNVVQTLGDLTGLSLEGNSLSIAANSTLNLSFDARRRPGALDWAFRWQGDHVAQLQSLLGTRIVAAGSPHPASVIYNTTQFGDFTYIGFVPRVGDLDGDADIDVADYLTLSTNLFTNVSALTTDQSYLLGDLTADLRVDGKDFADFRTAYDEANGAGAFVAMLATVPEPSTIASALLALCICLCARRRSSTARRWYHHDDTTSTTSTTKGKRSRKAARAGRFPR